MPSVFILIFYILVFNLTNRSKTVVPYYPYCTDLPRFIAVIALKHFHAGILPWQMNNTFIINENPPKMPYSTSICRSLPSCTFPVRLLNPSQNKQNAANRGKLRTAIVVKT